jgi:hypothetical protein
MPKSETNSNTKSYKDIAQKVLVATSVLYGVYWAVIGITSTKASWVDAVSDAILVLIVICGALVGLLSGSRSKK